MDVYSETKLNYDNGLNWHEKKSNSYDWIDQINRFIKGLKGKKILDAGCGTGRDITVFLANGLQVVGIDYSMKALGRCMKKYPEVNFFEEDLRNLNLSNKEFDGIWACASIMNLKKQDIPVTLSEFKRILKPNGELFVSVKEGNGEGLFKDKAGERYFSFFSLEEIRQLIRKAGFKIIYSEIIADEKLTGKKFRPLKPNWLCIYAINS